MNLSFWIARRYFLSRKKRSFINTLSLLSMLGVGVGTMALVVVQSVFNGMEALNRQIFKTYEADLTISPRQGKRFLAPVGLLNRLEHSPGIALLTPVVQDNALARYANAQTVVKVKGVADNYLERGQLDSSLVEGRLRLRRDGYNYAVVAESVRNDLSILPEDILTPLELWYPQNRGKTLNILSEDAFRQERLNVAGVFFIEAQTYNDVVLAPIDLVRTLIGYTPDQVTSLELQLKPGIDDESAKKALETLVGPSLQVQTRDELNPDLYRAIRVEKLFVTLALSLIILVASINIFFSLSMLVIEKKTDIGILRAMGATSGLIRQIFVAEGAIIALTGAILGLGVGVLLCLLQQQYGLVGLGTTTAIIDAYPVQLRPPDLMLTTGIVLVVTFVTSWFPAQRATTLQTH